MILPLLGRIVFLPQCALVDTLTASRLSSEIVLQGIERNGGRHWWS
jgi:hypothetical protein